MVYVYLIWFVMVYAFYLIIYLLLSLNLKIWLIVSKSCSWIDAHLLGFWDPSLTIGQTLITGEGISIYMLISCVFFSTAKIVEILLTSS